MTLYFVDVDLYASVSTEFIINNSANAQEMPAVASDGNYSIAVWQDKRNNDTYATYFTRVSREGSALDGTGVSIENSGKNEKYPVAVFNGAKYVIAWMDYTLSAIKPRLYGSNVTQSASVVDTFAINNADEAHQSPAVSMGTNNCLFVWDDATTKIMGSRVSQAGTVLDTITICNVASNRQTPDVSFDGTNFLTVWEDNRNGNMDIYANRITEATGGLPDGASGIQICTNVSNQYNPSVSFDGTNYLVVWEDWRSGNADIYGARVSTAGVLIDTRALIVYSGNQKNPSTASNGRQSVIVWEDERNDFGDIYGARVSKSLSVLDSGGFQVCVAVQEQSYAELAWNGNEFCIVWQDARNDAGNIYGCYIYDSVKIITASVSNSNYGDNYYAKLDVRDSAPPCTWTVESGNLPSGIVLNSGTGELTGTVADSGSFSFVIKVADNSSASDSKSYSISIPVTGGSDNLPNSSPSFSFILPSKNEKAKDTVEIKWTASDSDDPANICIYVDADKQNNDGVLIAGDISEGDGEDGYAWDCTRNEPGRYYVYSKIDDGKNPAVYTYCDYWINVPKKISVDRSRGGRYAVGNNAEIEFFPSPDNKDTESFYVYGFIDDGIMGEKPERTNPTNIAVDIVPSKNSFSGLFRLSLGYTGDDIKGLIENDLKMFYYNETNRKWEMQKNSAVSRENKTVYSVIDHLSIFRIMEPVADTSGRIFIGENTYVYPNPAKGNIINFNVRTTRKVPVSVEIFNIAYDLKETVLLESGGTGEVKLNLDVGNYSSGLYLCRITASADGKTETLIRKVYIIK